MLLLLPYFILAICIEATELLQPNTDCPPWTIKINNTCQCATSIKGAVKCNNERGVYALLKCYCMTLDKDGAMPIVGLCLYTCKIDSFTHYSINASTNEELENQTCGPYNRKGVMCGECVEGYGLPVYSYSLACVECSHYKYNWLKYIAVAYIPLTLFYFLVILFRISATSGFLIGYIATCQIITIQDITLWQIQSKSHLSDTPTRLLLTVLSVWNLDFFRALYQPFCIKPNMPILHVKLLEYILAMYPLVLILCTYALVKLHDRFRLLVWLCGPVYRCFHHFRKEWDIKSSLIGAFATFYLLSYVKIINLTATVLTPTNTFDINGIKSQPLSYDDPSIHYFGDARHPYAIFALLFSLLFNVFPLIILCLYTCDCFHRCLNKTGCRWQALHIFMDNLLGSYSHKPRERRFFGALYLGIRMFHAFAYAGLHPFSYLAAASYITIMALVLVAVCQPYKTRWYALIDIFFFLVCLHSYLGYIFYQEALLMDIQNRHNNQKQVYLQSASLLRLSFPLYGVILLIMVILPRRCISKYADPLLDRFCQRKTTELQESLPYRAEHNERQNLLREEQN